MAARPRACWHGQLASIAGSFGLMRHIINMLVVGHGHGDKQAACWHGQLALAGSFGFDASSL
eukprot:scaffold18916_cov81-Skeletonema_dohrnii-CCMP3373.AAC.4